jgi:hypothetical protein
MTISETDRARIVEAMARAMWLGPRPDLISGTALAILQRDAADALEAAEARVKELEGALREIEEMRNPLRDATPSDYARGFQDGKYRASTIAAAALLSTAPAQEPSHGDK